MKIVLWGVLGTVVLIIAVAGFIVYWTTHATVDFKDPIVAGKFKESFNTTCITNYQKRAKDKGAGVSSEELDKLDQACSCARDNVVDALARRAPMTVMDIAALMRSDPEIKKITDTCSARFGIAAPD